MLQQVDARPLVSRIRSNHEYRPIMALIAIMAMTCTKALGARWLEAASAALTLVHHGRWLRRFMAGVYHAWNAARIFDTWTNAAPGSPLIKVNFRKPEHKYRPITASSSRISSLSHFMRRLRADVYSFCLLPGVRGNAAGG